jgi:putative DNA primase/helicase
MAAPKNLPDPEFLPVESKARKSKAGLFSASMQDDQRAIETIGVSGRAQASEAELAWLEAVAAAPDRGLTGDQKIVRNTARVALAEWAHPEQYNLPGKERPPPYPNGMPPDPPYWTRRFDASARPLPPPRPTLRYRFCSDIEPIAWEWLWPDRLPIGALTIISGDPGEGKGTMMRSVVAAVTRGHPWPDRPDEGGKAPGMALVLSAEEDPNREIVPSLIAAGADLGRVIVIDAAELPDGGDAPFSLTRDALALGELLTKFPAMKLLVIDPINSYLDDADEHKQGEVRKLLDPLIRLAQKHGIAVVIINHLNKSGGKALYRVSGSIAFVAAPRMSWLIARDPGDRTRRLMLISKANICAEPPGMAFRILGGAVCWDPEPVLMHADDLLLEESIAREMAKEAKGKTGQRTTACSDWLETWLSEGPRTLQDTTREATDRGYTRTLLFNARALLGVIKEPIDNVEMLRLPNVLPLGDPAPESPETAPGCDGSGAATPCAPRAPGARDAQESPRVRKRTRAGARGGTPPQLGRRAP